MCYIVRQRPHLAATPPRWGLLASTASISFENGGSELISCGPDESNSGVEIPDFDAFMRSVVSLKARVDAGDIEAHPEIRAILDQVGALFEQFMPSDAASDDSDEEVAE